MLAGSRVPTTRIDLLGCPVDPLTMTQTVARVEDAIARRETTQHVAINAAKVVRYQHDVGLRAAVDGCELATADGQAVVWAARVLGRPLPERVAGIDLMDALLDVARSRGYRIFLLGARADVLERAEAEICRRYPGVRIVGRHHGYFGPEEEPAVVDEVAAATPELLFVALETPAKELFLARNRARLAVPFVMGVGGSFDVLAGERRRAPRWMRRSGLEWLYRLLQDPRRLARRYAVGNTQFVWLVLRDAVRIRLHPGAAGRG
jgi:N-acetylglucosaminyldiphosphoundecaprenol N-acetyl-beta-D-mannosaminyltransferase